MDNIILPRYYFSSEDVRLIPIEEEDIGLLQKWINKEEVSFFNGSRFPISHSEQKEYYNKLLNDSSKKKLIIIDKQNIKVGLVSLLRIDYKNANAEIAVYIDPEHQNKGYASKGLKLLIEFAFAELRMHKIYANIIDFNLPSIKTFEKIGFQHESTLKEIIYSCSGFRDILVFAYYRDAR